MRDNGGDDEDGGYENHRSCEDFREFAGVAYCEMDDDGVEEGDEKDLHNQPRKIL